MGLSPLDLSALGDWVNKRDLPQESKMPMHYSGARYGQSLRVKHMVQGNGSAIPVMRPGSSYLKKLSKTPRRKAEQLPTKPRSRTIQFCGHSHWSPTKFGNALSWRRPSSPGLRRGRLKPWNPPQKESCRTRFRGGSPQHSSKMECRFAVLFRWRAALLMAPHAPSCTNVQLSSAREEPAVEATRPANDKRAVKAGVESPSPKPTPAKAARLVGGRHPPGLPSAEQVVKKPAAKPRPRAAEPQSANPTATGSGAKGRAFACQERYSWGYVLLRSVIAKVNGRSAGLRSGTHCKQVKPQFCTAWQDATGRPALGYCSGRYLWTKGSMKQRLGYVSAGTSTWHRCSRLVGPIFATEVSEAKTWNKPLCQACYYRSPASTQMKLRNW